LIDDEVRKLVEGQYRRAIQLLTDKSDALEILAKQLLDKEVLLKSDVERLIGPRPVSKEELIAEKEAFIESGMNTENGVDKPDAGSDPVE